MSRLLTLTLLALAALVGWTTEGRATNYGNFVDPTGTVSYLNVHDQNGLFGPPSVSLDSIDFTPTTFQAKCTQCPDGVSTSDTLFSDIQASSFRQLDQIEITEGLDYTIQSFDLNGFAAVSVIADVLVEITSVNGAPTSGISQTLHLDLTPTNPSVFGLGAQASGIMLGTTGLIDLKSILTNGGGSGEVTSIRVSFGNILQAFHDGGGGQALIRKRDADFVSLTVVGSFVSNLPEPSTAVLMMSGLALLAGRRPRS
jgi:hypothetical protein